MYDKKETNISYKYLKTIISKLNEPIVIIGGWAVYLTVNKNYKKEFGINYIGSRDIDLGFNTIKSIKETCQILEENGFKLISFRYLKEINYETGKELTKEEAKTIPIYNIFSMYIDILISDANPKIKNEIGFMPADEPMIGMVFKDKTHRQELKEFNRKLWLPSPSLLLAIKLKSVINRSKDHKRIKDYCDIVAICLYSGTDMNNLISFIKENTSSKDILKLRDILNQEELKQVSDVLQIDINIINKVFSRLT
ncbi:MAG: hypothetical protein WCX82_04360 [archaeon]|jgi:hypothetical protein